LAEKEVRMSQEAVAQLRLAEEAKMRKWVACGDEDPHMDVLEGESDEAGDEDDWYRVRVRVLLRSSSMG
jgi:hypothetical protein